MELENNEVIEAKEAEGEDFFMVQDKDATNEACLTCNRFKEGSLICGIYKSYNDFITSRGKPSIESDFKCSEFIEAE